MSHKIEERRVQVPMTMQDTRSLQLLLGVDVKVGANLLSLTLSKPLLQQKKKLKRHRCSQKSLPHFQKRVLLIVYIVIRGQRFTPQLRKCIWGCPLVPW